MMGKVKTAGFKLICIGLAMACHQAWSQEAPAYALDQPSAGSRLKLSGFGTLGYFLINGPDDLQFRRELGQNMNRVNGHHERTDSRLGLQLNYQATVNTELVGQVVAREKADSRVFNSVEWAFAKYRPTQDVEVRAGRVGLATFMLSDYRNVGYAYNWVRPPAEFYGWIPLYSMDGGDAVHISQLGDGQLRAKVYGGRTEAGMPWHAGSYKLKGKIAGLGLAWESDEWRLRAYHTRVQFTTGTPFADLIPYVTAAQPIWAAGASLANDLDLVGKHLYYSVVGATWDHDSWQVSGELAATQSNSLFTPQGRCAYVSVGRRFDKFLPFVGFARNWDKRQLSLQAPPGGFGLEPVDAGIREAFAATRTDQYTASLGMRWDFAANAAIKLQWDRTVVDIQGTQLWGYGPVDWTGAPKHVWSASLDFTF